jgi:hypothetical protein
MIFTPFDAADISALKYVKKKFFYMYNTILIEHIVVQRIKIHLAEFQKLLVRKHSHPYHSGSKTQFCLDFQHSGRILQ